MTGRHTCRRPPEPPAKAAQIAFLQQRIREMQIDAAVNAAIDTLADEVFVLRKVVIRVAAYWAMQGDGALGIWARALLLRQVLTEWRTVARNP